MKIPYPLRAAKLSLAFSPFSLWMLPKWRRLSLTDIAKEQGETIWWARWLCFQVSYSRWV